MTEPIFNFLETKGCELLPIWTSLPLTLSSQYSQVESVIKILKILILDKVIATS